MPLVDESEWNTAYQYLACAPNGEKLAYSMRDGKARYRRPELFQVYRTTHSFIKINDEIFLLHHPLLGRGAYGRVKCIENRQGQRFVVKIESEQSVGYELSVLEDLGLSKGDSWSSDTEKNYTQMEYLGLGLHHVLRQPGGLDEARRFRLAISLCSSVHRLHHGLDSRSGTGYAHLDLKINNCTVDDHDKVHLVDFGAAESHVDSLLSLSMGTYVYAPPVNQRMAKYQYDSLALARTLYWSDGFHSADGYIEDYELSSVLTKKMINENGLDEFFNKSARYRPTLDSFIEDKTTPLMYAARLIASFYRVAVPSDVLRSNRLLCLVLLKLYERGADSSEIRRAVRNLETYLTDQCGGSDTFPVIKARTLVTELKLGVKPDDLTEDSEQVLLINQLDVHDVLTHWKVIEPFPPAWRAAIMAGSPEFLRALKMILDETQAHMPDETAFFRLNCLEDLFARPELAGYISANVIKARRLQKQYNFEHFARFPQATDTILLNAVLQKYALLPFRKLILDIPSLPDFILSPYVSENFFVNLREDCVAGGARLDRYREQLPLIELLHRRGVRAIDTRTLNEAQIAVIYLCDRVLPRHSEFQQSLNRFFNHTTRELPDGVDPILALTALANAGAEHLAIWLRRMTSTSRTEAARIYIRAACLLAGQSALSERYNEVLNALESAGERMEVLRQTANEVCGGDVCDPVMIIRPYAVGNGAVHVRDEEPIKLQIPDPLAEVQKKLRAIRYDLDWVFDDFVRNTWSLNEFHHLLNLANSERDVYACLNLCEELDSLRRKKASFDSGSEPWLAFQELISNVSDSIADCFEENTDSRPFAFVDQCRLLHQNVRQHIRAARPQLGSHRGILGWVDSFLAALASLVCSRPDHGPSPHAFFQTRSNALLSRFETTVANMPASAG